jgi:hypothetical protein
MAAGSVRAEDPFLGQIKEIKCVNCKPGWVTLVVHDPIDTRDFELYLKDTDYNKIITPLPGKRIHDRNGECFYWMERPKAKAKPGTATAPGAQKPAESLPAKAEAGKPVRKAPGPDSLLPAGTPAGATVAADSAATSPPPFEEQGTPSACIRFYQQMR